ncbi:MAG: DUF202 domain-containing protein [Myxococcota bacterium]
MHNPPETYYTRVPVKDGLAAERTVMAAERTFLAYVRSAFAMFVTGLTGSQLLDNPLLVGTGYLLATLSLVVFATGVGRFWRARCVTTAMLERLEDEMEDNTRLKHVAPHCNITVT